MITLTSSQSSKAEPFRGHRWIIQFSFPSTFTAFGSGDISTRVDDLAFCAHTSTVPSISFNNTEMHRLNEKFKSAGKPSFNDLSMSFYDFISKDGTIAPSSGENQAGRILYNWSKAIYDPNTGEMGYKVEYAANAALAQLDPRGNIVRTWNIFYIWPISVEFGGGLSYESDSPLDVTCNFVYDYATQV